MNAQFPNKIKREGAFSTVEMPCFVTSCLETGVKTLVTETGQQLPPSYVGKSLTKINLAKSRAIDRY